MIFCDRIVILDKILWNAMFYKLTKDREKMLYIYTRMLVLKNDTKGATAVEYGIIVALVAAVIITAVGTLGGKVLAGFAAINTGLS